MTYARLLGLFRRLLVLGYLLAPLDLPDKAKPPQSPEGWQALKAFNQANDLAMPWENYCTFAYELNWARTAYRDAVRLNLPPSCDATRFPRADVTARLAGFATEHAGWVWRERETLDEYESWHAESLALLEVYATASKAAGENFAIDRRRHLARLRQLMGPGNYYAGALPPPVPLWRFEWVNRREDAKIVGGRMPAAGP